MHTYKHVLNTYNMYVYILKKIKDLKATNRDRKKQINKI